MLNITLASWYQMHMAMPDGLTSNLTAVHADIESLD